VSRSQFHVETANKGLFKKILLLHNNQVSGNKTFGDIRVIIQPKIHFVAQKPQQM
jgi:hypothetical protein